MELSKFSKNQQNRDATKLGIPERGNKIFCCHCGWAQISKMWN